MNYNLKRKIESRNKRFAEANDAQKRVMIAKDALAQINEGRFIPKTGSYCRISSTAVKKSLKVGVKDLREAYLGNNINNCKVCGIGALMVASILFNNNVAVDSYIHYTSQGWGSPNDNNNEASNGIRKYFSHEQLRLIEHAFEIEVD